MKDTAMTTLTVSDKAMVAQRLAAAIVDDYRHARTRIWAGGDCVRVYVSDPRDRGYIEILADGRLDNRSKLGNVLSRAAEAIGAEVV
jgi:hypothetical protein